MNLPQDSLLQGGKYRIIKTLGKGGFGITYLGEEVALGREVAIKEFFMRDYCERDSNTSQVLLGTIASREMVERFKKKFVKEAQTILTLNHPHIIKAYEVFEENNTAYYVMEYIGSGSLNEKIGRGGLPEDVALCYIRQVADALSYLHARHMNHLDVKPGNVLITPDDKAVLIDFGLAKHYDEEGCQTTSTPVGISYGYAPTEQYVGGVNTFSAATDIYSLGATLYKAVTGVVPPDAEQVYENGLPQLPEHISEATRHAIKCAMQSHRKDRPQSIGEFLALLELQEKETEASKDVSESPEYIMDEAIEKLNLYFGGTPNGEDTLYDNENSPFDIGQGKDKTKKRGLFPKDKRGLKIMLYTLLVIAFLVSIFSLQFIIAAPLGIIIAVLLIRKMSATLSASKSFDALVKRAMNGDVDAQYEVAGCYFNGDRVARNYVEAMKWYREAARQGDARAQYYVGYCYQYECGVKKDNNEAVKWWCKAAEQGHADAQYSLHKIYLDVRGPVYNEQIAIEWCRKAAEQGHADALYYLGCYYDNGYVVTEDKYVAAKWWCKAAEQGHLYAQFNMGICYEHGRGVAKDTAMAVRWYSKAAEQGYAQAQYNLGICYYRGEGIEQNYAEAARWYQCAAEQGHADAQCNLGACYYRGEGVKKDNNEAVKWFKLAADRNSAEAQYNLGACYQTGSGVIRNLDKASIYYRRSAEQGYEPAQKKLLEWGL